MDSYTALLLAAQLLRQTGEAGTESSARLLEQLAEERDQLRRQHSARECITVAGEIAAK